MDFCVYIPYVLWVILIKKCQCNSKKTKTNAKVHKAISDSQNGKKLHGKGEKIFFCSVSHNFTCGRYLKY